MISGGVLMHEHVGRSDFTVLAGPSRTSSPGPRTAASSLILSSPFTEFTAATNLTKRREGAKPALPSAT
jgi:hypothetical protein